MNRRGKWDSKALSMLLALALVVSLGLVTTGPVAAQQTWIVNADGSGNYTTIQAAIDAAGSDDIIQVGAGNYTEDLVIPAGKDGLELAGAGCGVSIIKGVATADWDLGEPPVYNIRFDEFSGVSGVKIHGFTIESPDVPTNHFASGMVLNGQDIEIYNNCFVSKGAAAAVDNYCVAIQTWRWSAAPNSDITGLRIYDNTFTSAGDLWVYQGVFVNRDGENAGDVTVSGNTFTGNIHMGIAYEGNNAEISGNEMTSDFAGAGIAVMDWAKGAQNNVEVIDNTVEGFARGIVIGHGDGDQALTDISVTGNTVQNNDTGILMRSSAGGVVVNYNNIVDNSTYGVENTHTATLDATHNWWGDASGPTHAGNLEGTGDPVSDGVDYGHWLGAPLDLPAVYYDTLGPGENVVDASEEADTIVTLNVTAEASETDIYIARYQSQPFPDEPFPDETLGKYIDIHVSNPENVIWPVYVQVFYTDDEVAAAGVDENTLRLYYFCEDDCHFQCCSDTGVNTAEKFIWANVSHEEASDLAYTPFGGGGDARLLPPVGGEAHPISRLGILALWIALGAAVIAGVTIFVRRRRAAA
ncbi:MAG: right-handed parallel beta-helix repeat-containing protein [Dehalococcoidia bacterium]